LIARIGFALRFDAAVADFFDLAHVCEAGNAEIFSERTRCATGISVIGKRARKDHVEADFLERLRHRVRRHRHIAAFQGRIAQHNGVVPPHRKRLAQRLFHALRSHGKNRHRRLGSEAFF
jgi:hypothetical protein